MAPSLASAPELAKNTFPFSRPEKITRVFAVFTMGMVVYRLETCISLDACSETAFTRSQSPYPRQFTPMPEAMSMYSFPSTSQSRAPFPFSRATG